MMDDTAFLIAAAALVPLLGVICYFDGRYLRIPNWTVVAVIGVFFATASWGLPTETFLWRIGYGVATLAAGFALYQVASAFVGAGDLKLLAALAPFLSGATVGVFLLSYIVFSIVGLMVVKAMRSGLGERAEGFTALNAQGHFPAGVVISLSMIAVLLYETVLRLS